jgi:hypothetical protein
MSPGYRSSGEGVNPAWETIEAICSVCESDFGEGSEAVRCLRVRMDHCLAFYGCVCLDCARAIADALEDYDL